MLKLIIIQVLDIVTRQTGLCVLLSLLLTANAPMKAGEKVRVDDLCYELNDKDMTATVIDPLSCPAPDYLDEDEFHDEMLPEHRRRPMVDIPQQLLCNGKIYRVTGIGSSAFESCRYLWSVSMPNSITHIDELAFGSCEELQHIVLSDSIVVIADMTFTHCRFLQSIDIPDSVWKIGAVAFLGCENLCSLTLPAGIMEIGYGAFALCDKLRTVTCKAPRPPYITEPFLEHSDEDNAFYQTGGRYPDTLYVPKRSVRAYKKARQWKLFKYILPIPIGGR